MLAPLTLRGVTVPNRLVVVPRGDRDAAGLRQLAGSGAGLVLADGVAVSADGRITPADPGLYSAQQLAAWQQATAHLHDRSATLAGVSLSHAGRRGATRPRGAGLDRPLRDGGWPLLSPSALPYGRGSQTPKGMDADDMERVREAFAAAACLAQQAGFDLLQLDMSRGYLLGSFLSPLANQRDDEYGGAIEGRLRYPLQVLGAARAAWPAEKPLAVAISASDWQRGGNGLRDGVTFARALREHGCDLITVHAGQTTPSTSPRYDFETLAHYSDVIRTEVGIATVATPYITTSNQANTLLAGGRCDLCLYWPRSPLSS
jgi:anthraniloyl-CoA monooxygenase